MKISKITPAKFEETKRARKSGYRSLVIDAIRHFAENFVGDKSEPQECKLDEVISMSTWQFIRKSLVDAGVVVECGLVQMKDKPGYTDTLTFQLA